MMTENEKIDVVYQIKNGIDLARARGIVCGYPYNIVINGERIVFPWRDVLWMRAHNAKRI